MKLEIGNFHVRDIQFGDKLSFLNGVLTIQKEEAQFERMSALLKRSCIL